MEELKSLLIPLPAMKGDWRELFFVEETKISTATGLHEKKYAHSIEYLKKAEDLGLPDENLTFENYRLIGVNYFYLGEYQKAIDYFNKIAKSRRPMGEVNRAEDWIQRCEYEIFLNF